VLFITRQCPVADERKEDLKLLESAAGGEDGKPAKMLVPKAIDADDADGSDSDDESDDDESVRAGCALTEISAECLSSAHPACRDKLAGPLQDGARVCTSSTDRHLPQTAGEGELASASAVQPSASALFNAISSRTCRTTRHDCWRSWRTSSREPAVFKSEVIITRSANGHAGR